MHLILGLVIGFLGTAGFGVSSGILGGLVGLLAAEILSLRKRMHFLEKSQPPAAEPCKTAARDVVPPPASPGSISLEPADFVQQSRPGPGRPVRVPPPSRKAEEKKSAAQVSRLDRFFGGLGVSAGKLTAKISHFFTSGNLVLKIGIIILFFGVAFLLKYAAQRNMIPLEFRLVGVASSGMAMLGIGWWLRRTRFGYGLALQGGGVGILYLVVFAAAKLYDFLPISLSLLIMVGLVALSCMLAVLQAARSLAVFGVVGGFLAPVLMSTGGSHVLLFSYYALLNAGILGVAWYKSWRELNLLGFVFTFAVGNLWGSTAYQPEFFWSTEPFLVLFFIFYVFIAILDAHRQPVNLRGFIDGSLVFGLPLIVSGLQYFLVKDFPYGMAFSALGLGLFYLTLATVLWRRLVFSMHLLCEAFLALGVVFGSLVIPLALDGQWSASIWALEGAGMVWVGSRQKRVLARHFGILLQLAAGYIFLGSVWYPFSAAAFANQYFLGCLFLSLAALFSSYFLDRYRSELKNWEHCFALPLMIIGLAWWYIGGLREVNMQMASRDKANGFLLFCCASSILIGMGVKKLSWPRFELSLYLQLPAMVVLFLLSPGGLYSSSHLFAAWGAVAWTVAFVTQYRILFLFADNWPRPNMIAWHLGSLWLLFLTLSHEGSWAVGRLSGLSEVWSFCCWALIPGGGLLLLLYLGRGVFWPVGRYASAYLGVGGVLPALGLVLWTIVSFSIAGDPFPLSYMPLINPVEISGLIVLITLVLWLLNLQNNGYVLKYLPVQLAFWALGVVFFFWVNSVVARSVHFYVGIPYHADALYRSAIFQAALAALWGFGALAITVWAARNGSRPLWGAGAMLLAMVVLKLFAVDLSGTPTIARIVSFLVVGVLMLIIGYFSPLPPKKEENSR
jgi:uncharacterized membrane protein